MPSGTTASRNSDVRGARSRGGRRGASSRAGVGSDVADAGVKAAGSVCAAFSSLQISQNSFSLPPVGPRFSLVVGRGAGGAALTAGALALVEPETPEASEPPPTRPSSRAGRRARSRSGRRGRSRSDRASRPNRSRSPRSPRSTRGRASRLGDAGPEEEPEEEPDGEADGCDPPKPVFSGARALLSRAATDET